MDKILQSSSGAVTVTNDGATILKSIYIDNPAAKVGSLGRQGKERGEKKRRWKGWAK